MGYRTYIAIVDKNIIDDLHNCKTEEDAISVYNKYNGKVENWDDESYCPVYGLPYKEVKEFGSDYFVDDIFNHSQEIYTTDELKEKYQDSDFRFGSSQLLLDAIEDYRQRTEDYYNSLFENTASTSWGNYKLTKMSDEERKEHHYNRLLSFVDDKRKEWGEITRSWNLFPYDLKKETNSIISSWDREYAVFELVRLYKLMDDEKFYCVFYGW